MPVQSTQSAPIALAALVHIKLTRRTGQKQQQRQPGRNQKIFGGADYIPTHKYLNLWSAHSPSGWVSVRLIGWLAWLAIIIVSRGRRSVFGHNFQNRFNYIFARRRPSLFQIRCCCCCCFWWLSRIKMTTLTPLFTWPLTLSSVDWTKQFRFFFSPGSVDRDGCWLQRLSWRFLRDAGGGQP